MLFSNQIIILTEIFLASLATARLDQRGFVPPASWCLPTSNLTSLSGCIAMNDYQDQCIALSTNESRIDCYCQQEMLSDYYKCESDVTLCLGSPMFDSAFQSLIDAWHTTCTSLLTTLSFTPTTLPVSTLTSTYDVGACFSLALSCTSADYETNLCSASYLPAQTVGYLSCVCAEPVYSLFSECQYDGNVSCLATSAAESNILGWSYCSYFRPGASTLPPANFPSLLPSVALTSQAVSATPTSPQGTASSSALTLTKPFLPSATTTVVGPTATSGSAASWPKGRWTRKFVLGSTLRTGMVGITILLLM